MLRHHASYRVEVFSEGVCVHMGSATAIRGLEHSDVLLGEGVHCFVDDEFDRLLVPPALLVRHVDVVL
jgi:hypothetical protein